VINETGHLFEISFLTFPPQVKEVVQECSCEDIFPVEKIADGKYKIGENRVLIFVRVMRNHVMVRVGGGWDTLENYIQKHDPCRTGGNNFIIIHIPFYSQVPVLVYTCRFVWSFKPTEYFLTRTRGGDVKFQTFF
jgi:hypothetical protein